MWMAILAIRGRVMLGVIKWGWGLGWRMVSVRGTIDGRLVWWKWLIVHQVGIRL